MEVPPEGVEPSWARGPRRSERRAYAFRHGGIGIMAPAGIDASGSEGRRRRRRRAERGRASGRSSTRSALVFSQPLYR